MGFWLLDLLTEQEIRTPEELTRAFWQGTLSSTVFDLALAEETYSLSPLEPTGTALVAAHGLDLSGSLGCMGIECLHRDLHRLLSRTWFYFDQVAVRGPTKQVVRNLIDGDSTDDGKHNVESLMQSLLYIREVGAEEFLLFTEKRPACEIHYRDHLSEAGLDHILQGSESIIAELMKDGTVEEFSPHEAHLQCTFNHPMLEHTAWPCLDLPAEEGNPEIIKRAAAEAVFARFASHLTSDVLTARTLEVPLGLGTAVYDRLVCEELTETNVALALDLPILTDVTPRDAMKIRDAEAGSFDRFRDALKTAMNEAIASAAARPGPVLRRPDDSSASGVAADIINDVIGPSLNEIDDAMVRCQSVLNKKALTSVGVASIFTLAGLAFAAPLLLPAGIALFGGPTLAAHKYFEESRDIQLKDMYFLWSREIQARRRK